MFETDEDTTHFTVVVNAEGQYSIWRADQVVPDGWTEVGVTGPKSACLAHIGEVWTDLRPRSLRVRQP